MVFFDWALTFRELEGLFLLGEREERTLLFIFVTYFIIFSCQSKISSVISDLFYHDSLQSLTNLLVYWLPVDDLGCPIIFIDFNWFNIAWILFSYFLRSLTYLLICRFSLALLLCSWRLFIGDFIKRVLRICTKINISKRTITTSSAFSRYVIIESIAGIVYERTFSLKFIKKLGRLIAKSACSNVFI